MNAPNDVSDPAKGSPEPGEKPGRGEKGGDPDLNQLLGLGGSQERELWRDRRRLLIYGGGAAAALLVLSFLFGGSADDAVYVTEPATRADLIATVTATGAIEPTNQVDVSSELSGTVRRVLVDFNSPIAKGQVLAELDTDKLQASVDSARAKLLAARAKVKEAEATVAEKKVDLDRKAQLVDRRIVAPQEMDVAQAAHLRAEAALESAKADVVAAEADLKLNQTNLAKACICSPIDGVVLSRSVEPGQTVAASLQAPVLFTIAEDLSSMELQVDVDEADVGRVSEGQRARFTVDAHAGRTFTAEISELRYGSEVVNGVVTYKAVLTTDNAERLLRPGMTATADIVVQEVRNALTVPNAALRFTPPSDEAHADNRSFLSRLMPGPPRRRAASSRAKAGPDRTVWVLTDGEPRAIPVKVGATDGGRTEIVEGAIEAGALVIVDAETKSK